MSKWTLGGVLAAIIASTASMLGPDHSRERMHFHLGAAVLAGTTVFEYDTSVHSNVLICRIDTA